MIYTREEIQVAAGFATAELEALHNVNVPEFWAAIEKGLSVARQQPDVPHPNEPYLGLATTAQMLEELKVRAEVGGYAEYRTVDSE